MRHAGGAVLVDQMTGDEPVDGKRHVQRVRFVARDGVRENPAGTRCRLESPRAPAAIEIQTLDGHLAHDRAGVRADIDDAAPLTQHAHAAEVGKQFLDRRQGALDDREAAALAIAQVMVDTGTDHQFALVRLADVGMNGVGHDHAVQDRLDRLRHQRLQRMTLHRQAQAGHLCENTGVTGHHDADLVRLDASAGGLHAGDAAVVAANAGDFAVLDDVHAVRIGAAGHAPGDRVVTGGAGARLVGGAHDRVACVRRRVDQRHHRFDLLRRDELGVDAVEAIGVDPAPAVAHLLQGVREVEHATLAEHHVVVEVLAQPFPELKRLLVQSRRFVPQVVGTHDGGIAPGVAAADPALLQHGDIADAVLPGKVVRGGQPVPAAADDDDVVAFLRLGAAPGLRPFLVMAEGVARQAENRILFHVNTR